MANKSPHWGSWISERAEFVGFKRQQDFAAAIGCGKTQLIKWLKMPAPPRNMRKGFDARLAFALQATKEDIFNRWQTTPPEKARRSLFHADQLPPVDFEVIPIEGDVEQLLHSIIPMLLPREAEWLLEQAALKVFAAGDQREPQFRTILNRFQWIGGQLMVRPLKSEQESEPKDEPAKGSSI